METKIKHTIFEHDCFIFGSYVYKKMLRGEHNRDIDIACPNFVQTGNHLIKKFHCQLDKLTKTSMTIRCSNIILDLRDKSTIINTLSESNMEVFKLVLVGDKHLSYVEGQQINEDETFVEELSHNIKQCQLKHCWYPWLGSKHSVYFSEWGCGQAKL